MRNINKIFVILGSVFFVFSCQIGTSPSGDSSTVNPSINVVNSIDYDLAQNAIIMPNPEELDTISFSLENDDMTFFESSSFAKELSKGDTLIFESTETEPEGALRKVTEAIHENGKIIIKTEQAYLTDAYENFNLKYSQPIKSDNIKSIELEPGVRFIGSVNSITRSSNEFNGQISDLLSDFNENDIKKIFPGGLSEKITHFGLEFKDFVIVNDDDPDKKITIDGFLVFSITPSLEIEIINKEIVNADFSIDGDSVFSANYSKDIEIDVLNHVRRYIGKFNLGTIYIGSVPVTNTIDVYVGVEDGEIKAKLSSGVISRTSINSGIRLENNIWDFYPHKPELLTKTLFKPLEFHGNMNIKPYAGLRFTTRIYGIVGPYMEANAFTQIKGNVAGEAEVILTQDQLESEVKVNANLSWDLGIEMLLGINLNLLIREWDLWEKEVFSKRMSLLNFDASFTSNPPVADAGSDRTVQKFNFVFLDGLNSFDELGSIESYEWTIEHKPENSLNQIIFTNSSEAYFRPDVCGDYTLSLTVTDNEGFSDSDLLFITVIENETEDYISSPNNLSASSKIAGSIQLSWDDINEEDGYAIYKSVNDGQFFLLAIVPANVSNYSDISNLINGREYKYRISSYLGKSENIRIYSEPVSSNNIQYQGTDINPDLDLPNEVSNIFTVRDHNHVAIYWQKPSDLDFSHVKILFGINDFDNEFTGNVGNSIISNYSHKAVISGIYDDSLLNIKILAYDTSGNCSEGAIVTSAPLSGESVLPSNIIGKWYDSEKIIAIGDHSISKISNGMTKNYSLLHINDIESCFIVFDSESRMYYRASWFINDNGLTLTYYKPSYNVYDAKIIQSIDHVEELEKGEIGSSEIEIVWD